MARRRLSFPGVILDAPAALSLNEAMQLICGKHASVAWMVRRKVRDGHLAKHLEFREEYYGHVNDWVSLEDDLSAEIGPVHEVFASVAIDGIDGTVSWHSHGGMLGACNALASESLAERFNDVLTRWSADRCFLRRWLSRPYILLYAGAGLSCLAFVAIVAALAGAWLTLAVWGSLLVCAGAVLVILAADAFLNSRALGAHICVSHRDLPGWLDRKDGGGK